MVTLQFFRPTVLVSGGVLLASACGGADEEDAYQVPYRIGGDAGSLLTCGDGARQSHEECDGEDLAGQTCASQTFGRASSGKLRCSSTCHFDVSRCTAAGETGGGSGTGGGRSTGGCFGAGGASGR